MSFEVKPDFTDSEISARYKELMLFCSTTLSPPAQSEDVDAFEDAECLDGAVSSLGASFLKVEAASEALATASTWHWGI